MSWTAAASWNQAVITVYWSTAVSTLNRGHGRQSLRNPSMAFRMNKSLENELILCIARRGELRELLQQPLDWDYLLATAYAHGLLPLLHKNLAGAVGIVPAQFLSRL